MSVNYCNREELFDFVKENLQEPGLALDIGCGIRPQNLINPLVHICCEPYEEYCQFLEKGQFDQIVNPFIVLPLDWRTAVEKLPHKSVDTVFLIDVIEHLDKAEALELLKLTDNIAKKQIVIFTPLGFMPQEHPDGIDAWGLHGGAWQEHKSGWMPEDFIGDWNFYICENFHLSDNQGQLLEKPYGAFFAVKNNKNNDNFNVADLISIYKDCGYDSQHLIGKLINGYNKAFDNNQTILEKNIHENIELKNENVELKNENVELRVNYNDLSTQFSVIYNSPFSKLDRYLNRHLFMRFCLRIFYRIIKFFFKIKTKFITSVISR